MTLIALAANNAWNIVNFRSGLVTALKHEGYEVAVFAPDGPHADAVRALGAAFYPVTLDPRGLSPKRDLILFARYRSLLSELRPAAMLGYTAKPNIWGSLAARMAGVRTLNNISGLGTAFIRGGPLKALVSTLYRVALKRSPIVFFQNRDDRDLFVSSHLVRPEQVRLVPGSGVDLARFSPGVARKTESESLTFLMPSRLIRDKGVREFAAAAATIKARFPRTRFQLLGPLDEGGEAIPADELKACIDSGAIDYLGTTEDVRPYFAAADVVVLPSYREGTPKVLLEAAAMGLPTVATDVPGCREAVVDGETGLLCKARSFTALAGAMEQMIALTAEQRVAMGHKARAFVVENFDERIVHKKYIEALKELSIVPA